MYGLRYTHIRIKDQQLDFGIDKMTRNNLEIEFINKGKESIFFVYLWFVHTNDIYLPLTFILKFKNKNDEIFDHQRQPLNHILPIFL